MVSLTLTSELWPNGLGSLVSKAAVMAQIHWVPYKGLCPGKPLCIALLRNQNWGRPRREGALWRSLTCTCGGKRGHSGAERRPGARRGACGAVPGGTGPRVHSRVLSGACVPSPLCLLGCTRGPCWRRSRMKGLGWWVEPMSPTLCVRWHFIQRQVEQM